MPQDVTQTVMFPQQDGLIEKQSRMGAKVTVSQCKLLAAIWDWLVSGVRGQIWYLRQVGWVLLPIYCLMLKQICQFSGELPKYAYLRD